MGPWISKKRRAGADKCPLDPEDVDTFEDADGCPDPDNDGDGVLDVSDRCPLEPEELDGTDDDDGCPEPDDDGDGILDVDDDCPFDSEDRCRVRKTECSIIITEAIHFESAKDVIQPVSFPVLDSVRDALRSNPGIALLEVQGHTDSKGGDAYNQDLSQRRAASVVRYLTENHIEAARLSPIGHGEARPIASHRPSRGRAHNRRVEFIILDPKPTEECLQKQKELLLIYDPVGHRMLVYGGRNYVGLDVGQQTLALTLTEGEEAWSALAPGVLPPGVQERWIHTLMYDASRHRLVLMGGAQGFGGHAAWGDVWALPLDAPDSGWIELVQVGDGPGPVLTTFFGFYEPAADHYYVGHGAVYHSSDQYGKVNPAKIEPSVWALVPVGTETVRWVELRTLDPDPILRGVDLHWDPARNLGFSAFGRTAWANPGTDLYYNSEVRAYAIYEPVLSGP